MWVCRVAIVRAMKLSFSPMKLRRKNAGEEVDQCMPTMLK
jgi:hypothetical protein